MKNDQYLLYKLVTKAGATKPTKLPCNITGDVVDAHDSVHWVDRATAELMAQALGLGVAYVLTDNDPYFLLDIDGALQPDNTWSDVANDLCARFPGALIEVSQSGTGLHIIGSYTGQPHEHKCKNTANKLELYHMGRFIALGHADTRRGDPDINCSDELARVIAQYFPADTVAATGEQWTNHPAPGARPIPSDDELIAKALASRSATAVFSGGATFADLWNCNVDALTRAYPTQNDDDAYGASEADAALAAHLAWWTGADCERMNRLMRQSGLVRDKWDSHRSYMTMTVGSAAGRAIARGDFYQAPEAVITRAAIEPCETALTMAADIQNYIETKINNAGQQVADWEPATIHVSAESIHMVITRSFWSGAKSKLFVLSDEGALNAYKQEDMLRICQKHFGKLWDQQIVDTCVQRVADCMQMSSGEQKDLQKDVTAYAITTITDHLKMNNQRERVDTRVDMFAEHPRVIWYPDKVTVMHAWQPLVIPSEPVDPVILADYLAHFPQCDELLQQIVASRFASDRKKFYTWIKCGSDWGKGLFATALTKLGLCVELSVSECEKAFEGAPLGREAIEFARAFVVMFNEFKNVKSELKQLENELPVTPKNQLKQSAEIFTKLFTSAESVDSLAGENGVEDQFANRFSYFEGHGSIGHRSVFQQVGRRRYMATVTRHFAERVTELVDYYLSMGADAAVDAADRFGDSFHERWGIGNYFDRLSESVPQLGQDWLRWVLKNHQASAMIDSPYLMITDDAYYIRSAAKLWGDWVNETCNRSEIGTISKKRAEVFRTLSGGERPKSHRVNDKVFTGLRIPRA